VVEARGVVHVVAVDGVTASVRWAGAASRAESQDAFSAFARLADALGAPFIRACRETPLDSVGNLVHALCEAGFLVEVDDQVERAVEKFESETCALALYGPRALDRPVRHG
jgi:hypothetical protein